MIGVNDMRKYLCVFECLTQWFGHIDVIYTPALVIAACVGKGAPPGILVRILIKMPERIDKVMSKQFIHPGALLGQEAGIILITHGIMYIYRLVADIVITTYDQLWPLLA